MMLRGIVCALLLLGLTGCGNDDPGPQPIQKDIGGYVPPAAATQADITPAANDPLASGDTLAPADPMETSQGGLPTAAPLAPDDDSLDSSPKMPTQHSHWLHGSISSAQVAVTLDGAPLGTFNSPVDKDITMRLRSGVNTITFAYTPQGSLAFAQLNVLESEHDPPIPPLAVFRSPIATDEQPPQPLTQTFTFIAH
jgi:hypothetical protein